VERIRLSCPVCGKPLDAPASAAGKRVVCPHCNGLLAVPGPRPTSQAAPAQPSAGLPPAPAGAKVTPAPPGTAPPAPAPPPSAPVTRVCPRCGETVRLAPEDFGKPARCTSCWAALPPGEGEVIAELEYAEKPHRLAQAAGWAVSLALHVALLVCFAGMTWLSGLGTGRGEAEVSVGDVARDAEPTVDSTPPAPVQMQAEAVSAAPVSLATETQAPAAAPIVELGSTPAAQSAGKEAVMGIDSGVGGTMSATATSNVGALTGGSAGPPGSWPHLMDRLRRYGLDIVLVFDSTGSMAGEIQQVKEQILGIGKTLTTMIPKARISICTYRDIGDEYVVKGLPLTHDMQKVAGYMAPIAAGGGGDYEEQVQEGLAWAVRANQFNPSARKVILLFGDAPPHPRDREKALGVCRRFHQQFGGVVSTVTCHHAGMLKEFVEMAKAGGGEAFTSTDERKIVEQLIILVFGSKHEAKVREAFRLMER